MCGFFFVDISNTEFLKREKVLYKVFGVVMGAGNETFVFSNGHASL